MKPSNAKIKKLISQKDVIAAAVSVKRKAPLNRAQLFALRLKELDALHSRELKSLTRLQSRTFKRRVHDK